MVIVRAFVAVEEGRIASVSPSETSEQHLQHQQREVATYSDTPAANTSSKIMRRRALSLLMAARVSVVPVGHALSGSAYGGAALVFR